MAITAVSADFASQVGIIDPQSLAESVPGLTYNRQANISIPFLRGVGSPVGEVGDEPSVALYVDDVYLPSGAGSFAGFGDLDHIEVEKGPQGTVFGRNATGGVVQIFTRNPTPDPTLELTVGLANYNTKSGAFYASGPVTSTLSANLSIDGTDQSEGWGRYALTGAPAFTGWEYGGRTKLLWTPVAGTSVLLAADYRNLRNEEGLNFRAFPGTGSLNPFPPPSGGFPPPAGYYDNNQNLETYTLTRQSGVSVKLTSDFDLARLVSITAWRFTKAFNPLDEDAGPLPLVNAYITTSERTWTQEIHLLSPALSSTKWIAGFFLYKDLSQYMPLRISGDLFAPAPFLDSFTQQTTQSWAGFAQATREILPATHLTIGLRYTNDHRELKADAILVGGPPVPAANSPQSASWSKVTDRIVVDHQFADDLMAYVGYNRGFKSGLFNPVVFPGAKIGAPVAPEVLDAYTLGAKSEYLEHQLRVNAEAFYYRFKNIQVDQIITGTTQITNAAEATIKGIDLDITAVPVPRLTINLSMEVLSGRYDSFPNGLFNVYNPLVGGNCAFNSAGSCPGAVSPANYNPATRTWDLRGNHTVNSPPFSSSFTISYEIPSARGLFTLAASWSHSGNYYADADNGLGQLTPSSSANDQQGVVNLLNSSVTWKSSNARWQIQTWGKNLTGERYWSYATELAFVTQYSAAPPRTFGVTAGYHW
jgi:iron complex outermembrane receptor protein